MMLDIFFQRQCLECQMLANRQRQSRRISVDNKASRKYFCFPRGTEKCGRSERTSQLSERKETMKRSEEGQKYPIP